MAIVLVDEAAILENVFLGLGRFCSHYEFAS
jgi:hypothetical protein